MGGLLFKKFLWLKDYFLYELEPAQAKTIPGAGQKRTPQVSQ